MAPFAKSDKVLLEVGFFIRLESSLLTWPAYLIIIKSSSRGPVRVASSESLRKTDAKHEHYCFPAALHLYHLIRAILDLLNNTNT